MGGNTLKIGGNQTFNWEYFHLWQEFPLAIFFYLFKKREKTNNNDVLIVNTCLIGEFVVSLPAIADYINKNNNISIDILVSPINKPLAERIIGVRNILIANSVHGREGKKNINKYRQQHTYKKIIILRISKDAYSLIYKMTSEHVRVATGYFIRYGLHVLLSMVAKKHPKRLKYLNFEMLGSTNKNISLNQIIQFTNTDYALINNLKMFSSPKKKIVVHTHTWIMKCWPNDKWISFIKKINMLDDFLFIFVGTGTDMLDYKYIAQRLGFQSYSLIGKIDLALLLLILTKSDYFVGVDSGPSNMAHLARTRSVTILGPGPHMYMPDDKYNVVVDRSNGRGLLQLFFSTKYNIIDQISVDEAYGAFMRVYQKS